MCGCNIMMLIKSYKLSICLDSTTIINSMEMSTIGTNR